MTEWHGQTAWRWMFGLTALPAAMFLAALLFVPESPRWLLKVGRRNQARRALGKIGSAAYVAAAMDEIEGALRGDANALPLVPVAGDQAPKSRTNRATVAGPRRSATSRSGV